MSYFTRNSDAFIGTKNKPACDPTGPFPPDGWYDVVCGGEVEFIWLHSGYGDSEATACASHLAHMTRLGRFNSPRIGFDHGLHRDGDGVWRLKEGARLL